MNSTPGNIRYASHQGTYVLCLKGDLRVTLCMALDQLIRQIFTDSQLKGVFLDLTEAEAIDSTTLGLIAKIAVNSQQQLNRRPTLLSTNPDISRLLDSMGFDQVFHLLDAPPTVPPVEATCSLPHEEAPNEQQLLQTVLQAHRTLMDLNEHNHNTFTDLVSALEKEQPQT